MNTQKYETYKSIHESLQKMGRQLAKLKGGWGGFARQNNKVFALLSEDSSKEESEQVLVEFIDQTTLNMDDEDSDMPQWVRTYRRIELSTAHISKENARKIFKYYSEEKNNVFLAEVRYRHLSEEQYARYLETNDVKENTYVVETLYSAGVYQLDFIDLAEVEKIREIYPDEQENIDKIINMEAEAYENEKEYINDNLDKNSKYILTVYNAGQGLATSLALCEDNQCDQFNQLPFFYFDYGIGYGNNRFTVPKNIQLPIDEKGTIILSHVHEDHWCGFRINNKALKCRWVVPQKVKRMGLKKLLASVVLAGGSFSRQDIKGNYKIRIKNACKYLMIGNEKSTIKPSRVPKDAHQTGCSLYVFALYDKEKFRIVISGDQDYDYQNQRYLKSVNLLVACHHGGPYSWSKKTPIPTPDSKKNKIIYSYGKNNKHNHPSKVNVYYGGGWKNDYHTPNGDYKIEIELMDDYNMQNIMNINLNRVQKYCIDL